MARTVHRTVIRTQGLDRQAQATTGNYQREMPFFSTVKPPAEVSQELVVSCRDELMALNRCIDLSGMSDEAICATLGVDPGHWSRIRKGRAHFPARKRLKLMELCGNILPLQYEALRMGYQLDPISKDETIRRLERELAQAKAAA